MKKSLKNKLLLFDKTKSISIFYCLLAIIAAGAFLRFYYFHCFKQSMFYLYPILDAEYYDNMGKDIAGGKLIQDMAFFMGPLYPYFLGLVYKIFGHTLSVPRFVQIFLGLSNCALLFFIGKKVFRSNITGLVSALLWALYKPGIIFEQFLLMEIMVSFFLLAVIINLLKAFEKKTFIYTIISGLLLGFGALTRGNILLIAPPAALCLAFILYSKYKFRFALTSIIIFTLCVIAGIIPATIHNYLAEKDFVLVTSNSGINLYIGNNDQAEGEFAGTEEFDFQSDTRGQKKAEIDLKKTDLKSSEISKYWSARAKDFILKNPGKFCILIFRKLYYFWGREEIPQLYIQDLLQEMIPFLKFPLISFALVGPLSLIGIFLCFKKLNCRKILLLIFAFFYIISILPFFVTDRYRICIVPVLILFAGFSLRWFLFSVCSGKFRYPAIFIISFSILIFLLNDKSVRHPDREKAKFYNNIGLFYMKNGNFEKAEENFKLALSSIPKATTIANLGTLYLKYSKNPEKAYLYFTKALSITPNNPRMNYNAGLAAAQSGKIDEAIYHLEKSDFVNQVPQDINLMLGILYQKKNDYKNAAANLEKHIAGKPDDDKAAEQLILCYKNSDQSEKGIELLKKLVSKTPSNYKYIFNLGVFYQMQEKNNEALAEYEKVLKIKPDFEPARKAIDSLNETNNFME